MSSVHETNWEDVASLQARGPASDGNNVHIYDRSIEDRYQSKLKGRPIFMSRPYIRIQSPGMSKSVFDQPVTPEHKLIYPDHWHAYEAKEKLRIAGTPINEWQEISRTRAMELENVGVFTVEQLAEFPDDRMGLLGEGASDLRKKADAYLKGGMSGADKAEVENLRARIIELEQKLLQKEVVKAETPEPQPEISEREMTVLKCIVTGVNTGSAIAELTGLTGNQISALKKTLIKKGILKDIRMGLEFADTDLEASLKAAGDVAA